MTEGKREVCKLASWKKAELSAKRREVNHRKKTQRTITNISVGPPDTVAFQLSRKYIIFWSCWLKYLPFTSLRNRTNAENDSMAQDEMTNITIYDQQQVHCPFNKIVKVPHFEAAEWNTFIVGVTSLVNQTNPENYSRGQHEIVSNGDNRQFWW